MKNALPRQPQQAPLPNAGNRNQTLRACVNETMTAYLASVDEEYITNLYDTVLSEVEPPLLRAVMQKARSNQSKAAQMLGLNRGTLRKKMKLYNLD